MGGAGGVAAGGRLGVRRTWMEGGPGGFSDWNSRYCIVGLRVITALERSIETCVTVTRIQMGSKEEHVRRSEEYIIYNKIIYVCPVVSKRDLKFDLIDS